MAAYTVCKAIIGQYAVRMGIEGWPEFYFCPYDRSVHSFLLMGTQTILTLG